jgi:SlyX protein
MDVEQRIADLETRLAFQDDTIQALSDELVAQQRVVDRLQTQLGLLARRQEDMQSRMGDIDESEAPPPHY